MADKTKVRVTIEPGVVREVDDAELIDLARQGLIHSYERSDHAAEVLVDTPVKTKGRWKAPAKGEEVVEAPASVAATTTDLHTEGA